MSPRLPDLPPTAQAPFEDHEPLPLPERKGPPPQADAAVQARIGPPARAITRNGFDGVGANGSAPPDTNIAVGPNHIVEVVNSRYQVFNKAGTSIFGPGTLSSLWASIGGSCSTANAGDPVVQYDRLADRWVITQLGSLRSPYSQCIAVSKTGDPTGQYYLYSYGFSTNLNDYPKFGVWPTATNSAYTATYNMFANGQTFAGGQMCAYDRASMLAGAAAPASICYTISTDGGFLPVDLDGATPPTDGTPAYFLTWETTTSLRMYKLSPNFANTAASTLTQMPDLIVSSFVQACDSCVPQLGTTQTLDTLSDRPMYRLAYRVFGDHASMVVNHTVTSGPGSNTGVRWYELRTPLPGSGSFSVYQQSTFAPDATYRWMGSAAMDQAGNLAIGYSASSSSLNPALRYTGRYASDPLNTMQSETSIRVGGGSQGTGLARWGDYSALRIDPADDCTFWFSSEYEPANGTFNWVTYMGSFSFPNCAAAPTPDFTVSASPAAVTLVQGNSGGSTITLTAVNGYNKSVNVTVSGCPSGATCSVSPTAVTPTGTTALSIAAGTAATGSYTLTVQGSDGTLTHSTTVGLTVQPKADFSMSASPTSVTLVQGNSDGSTITLTAANGYNKSVNLTVTGCPTGATCSVSPTAVTPTGTTALSIATGTAATGSYTLTVQGSDGTLTHSTTVGLTVQPKPDFSMSASPTSVSLAQGNSGGSTITLTALNGYNTSVNLTVTGCPAGATCSVSPTAVTPTGTSALSIATGTAATGSYTLTVQGSAGTLTHSTTVGLTVQPKPDFSITASPASVSIAPGGNGSSTITLAALNGYNKSVGLSVLGCPTGATCSVSPANVVPTGNSTLTISGGTAAPGQYPLSVQGSDGTLTHNTSVTLTIQSAADFTITLNPASLSFKKGNSNSTTVTITEPGGTAPVALSVTGLPANLTASFSPTSVANGTSTLTVTAKGNATRGTYNLVVSGSNAAATHTTNLSVTIQ